MENHQRSRVEEHSAYASAQTVFENGGHWEEDGGRPLLLALNHQPSAGSLENFSKPTCGLYQNVSSPLWDSGWNVDRDTVYTVYVWRAYDWRQLSSKFEKKSN